MAKPKKNTPQEVLRDGFLKVTIWKNKGDNGDYFTASPAKIYEKDGDLTDCNSYSDIELLRLSELGRRAYARIRELRSELPDSREKTPTP